MLDAQYGANNLTKDIIIPTWVHIHTNTNRINFFFKLRQSYQRKDGYHVKIVYEHITQDKRLQTIEVDQWLVIVKTWTWHKWIPL